MAQERLLIIADTDGNDLVFQIASPSKGLSEMYRAAGQAQSIAGNPYIVYGKEAKAFMGKHWGEFSLIVAHVRSGQLVPYTG